MSSASSAPSSSSPTQQAFLNLRKRLATEERPAGLPTVVVALTIGDEAWVIDLRDGLPADQAVRRGDADAPDVGVKMSQGDFTALLEGRLTAFKAYTSKRLRIFYMFDIEVST